jgi:hypothetical protein
MGWEPEFLQSAVDTCTNPSGEIEDCPLFNIITEAEASECKLQESSSSIKALDDDNCAGPAKGLCGNVPIQYGPEYASDLRPGNTAPPTSAVSLAASSGADASMTSIEAVPTLSYKAPTSAVTDKYGGGISVANVNGGEVSVDNELHNTPKTTSSSSSTTPAAAVPVVTSAPAPVADSESEGGSIVATTTYTSAGTVYEVAIEEVEVYVTVEAPAPAMMHKRHAHAHHMHHRRDKEHGLLGRY